MYRKLKAWWRREGWIKSLWNFASAFCLHIPNFSREYLLEFRKKKNVHPIFHLSNIWCEVRLDGTKHDISTSPSKLDMWVYFYVKANSNSNKCKYESNKILYEIQAVLHFINNISGYSLYIFIWLKLQIYVICYIIFTFI